MTIPSPIIPREHGAWAVLVVPMLLGAAAAGAWTLEVLLCSLAALIIFLGYVPVQIVLRHHLSTPQEKGQLYRARFWSCAYVGTGLLLAMPLLVRGYALLYMFGAIGIASLLTNFLLTRRSPKTITSDLVAVLGLTLTGPGAYYVSTGMLDERAAVLWLLNLLFFGCSVFYVHMKLAAASARKPELSATERLSIGKYNILYHVVVVGLVGLLVLNHRTSSIAVIAFIPMAIHALVGTYTLSRRVRFRTVGYLLLGQSLLFALVLWKATA
jgi:hypothetical protein